MICGGIRSPPRPFCRVPSCTQRLDLVLVCKGTLDIQLWTCVLVFVFVLLIAIRLIRGSRTRSSSIFRRRLVLATFRCARNRRRGVRWRIRKEFGSRRRRRIRRGIRWWRHGSHLRGCDSNVRELVRNFIEFHIIMRLDPCNRKWHRRLNLQNTIQYILQMRLLCLFRTRNQAYAKFGIGIHGEFTFQSQLCESRAASQDRRKLTNIVRSLSEEL